MQYRYITENNLEYTQNYMYTQYGGPVFLAAYYQSRKPFLEGKGDFLLPLFQAIAEDLSDAPGETAEQLLAVLQSFDCPDAVERKLLDLYVRRFEVRKRLFSAYDPQSGRPAEGSNYGDIRNYILLSAITGKAYQVFRSLKYLNCLLKLNDTLISLAPGMTDQQVSFLKALVTYEVQCVDELARRKNVIIQEV